jgi:hypothetical protein
VFLQPMAQHFDFSPRIPARISPVQPIALDVLRTSGVLARGRFMAIRWPRAHPNQM